MFSKTVMGRELTEKVSLWMESLGALVRLEEDRIIEKRTARRAAKRKKRKYLVLKHLWPAIVVLIVSWIFGAISLGFECISASKR